MRALAPDGEQPGRPREQELNQIPHPRAPSLARTITDDFYDGRLNLALKKPPGASAWSSMPEVECADRMRDSGRSDASVRRFLTFIAAVDRMRDAMRLWHLGLELFQSSPEVFEPAAVAALPFKELGDRLRESGVSKFHRADSEAWQRIARTLSREPSSAVYLVIANGVGNAGELLRDLRRPDRRGRARYPQLRGRKIGPMWVRMMANPGHARIHGIGCVPVAVDVQVRRVTENLGVTATRGLPIAAAKPVIQAAWSEAVNEVEIGGPPGISGTCAALDPALWYFGREGCSRCERLGRRTPISSACDSCVWSP